jgi:flagellin
MKFMGIVNHMKRYVFPLLKLYLLCCLAALSILPERASSERAEKYIVIPLSSNFFVYGNERGYSVLRQSEYLHKRTVENIRRLSSGLRIVTAGDDPANFAVAEKMKSLILEIQRRSLNEGDLRNYFRYVESAIEQDIELLRRMRTVVLRASSGILAGDDREIIQAEIDALRKGIDMNASLSRFNRKQVIPRLTSHNLGIHEVDVVSNLGNSLGAIDRAINRLIGMRSVAGTKTALLELRIRGKSIYYVNMQAAESRIRDLDMASEISALLKNYSIIRFSYGVIVRSK